MFQSKNNTNALGSIMSQDIEINGEEDSLDFQAVSGSRSGPG